MIKLIDILREISNPNPKMIIMAGGAGAGKSTLLKGKEEKAIEGLIQAIPNLSNFEYFNPDTYVEDKNSPMFNQLTAASNKIDDIDVPEAIKNRKNFIWDTTAANAAKMIGGEYKRKQTPGILNTPDYDKMMIMVYAHPIVSFLENFNRLRKVPKIAVISTWNNVYGNIEKFKNKLGDNFILYQAEEPRSIYKDYIEEFNEAVQKGGVYEFLEKIIMKDPEKFASTFRTKPEDPTNPDYKKPIPLTPEEEEKKRLASEKSKEKYKGDLITLEKEFNTIEKQIEELSLSKDEIISKINTFIK